MVLRLVFLYDRRLEKYFLGKEERVISNPFVSELFLLPLALRPQRLCGFLIIQMLPDLI